MIPSGIHHVGPLQLGFPMRDWHIRDGDRGVDFYPLLRTLVRVSVSMPVLHRRHVDTQIRQLTDVMKGRIKLDPTWKIHR